LQEAVSYFTLMNQDSRNSYARTSKPAASQPRKKTDKKSLGDDDLDKDFVRYS